MIIYSIDQIDNSFFLGASSTSAFMGSPQLQLNPAVWNGGQHHSLMYRQHMTRTQHSEYPWPHHAHTLPYQPDMAMQNTQTEYMNDQSMQNSIPQHNAENMNALTDTMVNLRFEGTAGLSQNSVPNIPNENVRLTPPAGMGGIGLGDSVWDRQEGEARTTPLTTLFKL
jgi:hypothetical protein